MNHVVIKPFCWLGKTYEPAGTTPPTAGALNVFDGNINQKLVLSQAGYVQPDTVYTIDSKQIEQVCSPSCC